MHLLIGFLSGSLLMHTCVDDLSLSWMIFVSLDYVDGNIPRLYESIIFSSNMQHIVPLSQ